MLDIISIIVISLLIYILLVVLLNFIQAFSWGCVKIKLKNKKMIGKEQPIYMSARKPTGLKPVGSSHYEF